MTKHSDLLKESPFSPKNMKRTIGLDIPQLTYFTEHRSGWNYVTECFEELHNPNGYKLIDFIEKPWGWNAIDRDTCKGIYFDGVSYFVDINDVKCINNMEYVYIDQLGVIFWNGEEWCLSEMITVDQVKNAASYGIMDEYWIGIFHNPPNIPDWFDHQNSPQEIVQRYDFQKSLEYCRGIYVFSEYLKDELFKLGGWPCPINVISHPINYIEKKWIPAKFKSELIQVGYWLRRLSSIWEVKLCSKWKKIWINRAEYGWECFNRQVYNENKLKAITKNDVSVIALNNEEYDNKLQSCVIFLHLYDSSINNSVLEAIIRHTPIVINKIKPIIEILGADYPLYFDELNEVDKIITDTNIMKAHLHLKKLEESGRFYKEYFIENITSQSILVQKEKYDGPVISLGVDCLPRAMCVKFGFKPNKKNGGLTMPFDLAWHDYSQICKIIETDFYDYLNPSHLYLNKDAYIQHRIFGTLFNHESDSMDKSISFMRNDWENFVTRYQTRIKNFYDTISSNDSLVFVLHYNKYPVELVNVIKNKWPEKKFIIITLNTPYFHESHQDQPTNVEVASDNFLFFTIRYPFENYVWYEHQSPEHEGKIKHILDTYLSYKYDNN